MFLSQAQAGALGHLAFGRRGDFYDWEFAKKVWFEMNTFAAEEAEWAKYAADFDPWFVEWKKNNAAAKKLLASYPEQRRRNIERAYDMQLAWDTWYDTYYAQWLDNYRGVVKNSPRIDILSNLVPFANELADRNAKSRSAHPDPCIPKDFLTQCGRAPDWRSADMIAEERKLEALREKRLKGH